MFKRILSWFRQRRLSKARLLWVQALRSGEYKQTTEVLCRIGEAGNSHCCLGVACEVYDKHVKPLDRKVSDSQHLIEYDRCGTSLPKHVADWLGITTSGELKQPVGKIISLIGCNDAARMSFDQIAAVIEGGNLKEANNVL